MIAQLNCFTFGYLFAELVVGSPVGVRNFLSVALASARSRLSPFFLELATYAYVDNPVRKMAKTKGKNLFFESLRLFEVVWPDLRA